MCVCVHTRVCLHAHACECTHVHVFVCLFDFRLYSNIRIQYKIDDNRLSAKSYFLETWLVFHLLTEHKRKR